MCLLSESVKQPNIWVECELKSVEYKHHFYQGAPQLPRTVGYSGLKKMSLQIERADFLISGTIFFTQRWPLLPGIKSIWHYAQNLPRLQVLGEKSWHRLV